MRAPKPRTVLSSERNKNGIKKKRKKKEGTTILIWSALNAKWRDANQVSAASLSRAIYTGPRKGPRPTILTRRKKPRGCLTVRVVEAGARSAPLAHLSVFVLQAFSQTRLPNPPRRIHRHARSCSCPRRRGRWVDEPTLLTRRVFQGSPYGAAFLADSCAPEKKKRKGDPSVSTSIHAAVSMMSRRETAKEKRKEGMKEEEE